VLRVRDRVRDMVGDMVRDMVGVRGEGSEGTRTTVVVISDTAAVRIRSRIRVRSELFHDYFTFISRLFHDCRRLLNGNATTI